MVIRLLKFILMLTLVLTPVATQAIEIEALTDRTRVGLEESFALELRASGSVADELRLLPVLDATTVLLSGINWLRWLLLDARQFEQMETVWCRLGEIMIRLEHLACCR